MLLIGLDLIYGKVFRDCLGVFIFEIVQQKNERNQGIFIKKRGNGCQVGKICFNEFIEKIKSLLKKEKVMLLIYLFWENYFREQKNVYVIFV